MLNFISSTHITNLLTHFTFQLEHTGTTITQTLAGLWLDSNVKKEKSGIFAILSDNVEPRLQWLLNGFLFINMLHLVAIWGLGHLNEKKQNVKQEVVTQNEDEEVDEEERHRLRGVSPSSRRSVSPDGLFRSRSPNDRIPPDHTASPLLRPRDASTIYQTYGTHPRSTKSPSRQDTTTRTSPAEERRGKLFASMSALIVAFAWVLFLITSFIKIRSKKEREGH